MMSVIMLMWSGVVCCAWEVVFGWGFFGRRLGDARGVG